MTLFEQQEGYYKPKIVSSFLNNNCIEYESNGDKNSNLSLDKFLNKIKSYLRDIIIYLQSSDAWKIQLTIAINFISSKDTGEESVMHSTSDSIKFRPYNDECQVVNELFESLRSKYQDNLETSMRGSDLIFDSVQLMYYNPANICWSSTRLQRNNFFFNVCLEDILQICLEDVLEEEKSCLEDVLETNKMFIGDICI